MCVNNLGSAPVPCFLPAARLAGGEFAVSCCQRRLIRAMTSDKLDLSETNAMISEDEALNKMRDTVEQQFAELGDKVAALATRYESDSKARKEAGGRITLDLSQKVEAPSRRPPCAEDGLVIFCEFEGVACSIDTEAALGGEAGSAGAGCTSGVAR